MKVPVYFENHKILVVGAFSLGQSIRVDFGYRVEHKDIIIFSKYVCSLDEFYNVAPSFRA